MHSTRRGVICVVTNDPVPNGNAVLTYLNDGVGNLSPICRVRRSRPTAPDTQPDCPAAFGPFDLDPQFDAVGGYPSTVRHQWWFNSIAIFDIFDDGSLQPR